MTPRNPWRHTWHEKVVPLLWLVAIMSMIGVAVGIKSAHANACLIHEQAAAHYSSERVA
ncbi:hypothetical protein [Mycolicibacter minnesotensis]